MKFPPPDAPLNSAPTVGAALARAVALLAPSSPTPHADAQILLAWTLDVSREWLLINGDAPFRAAPLRRFERLCVRRARGVPVAYLIGTAGFYGRVFAVTADTLIPRPETEHLAEAAITHLRARRGVRDPLRVLDCGTGSGALACTIAAELPGVLVDATDTSAGAVAVAQQNARALGVVARCAFFCADIVPPSAGPPYDVVVANLPYIPTADIPAQPDPAGFEPLGALDGGLDGLDVYRKLLRHVGSLVSAGGLLLLEAAPPTISRLLSLTQAALPDAVARICCDYGGQERFVHALRSEVVQQ